MEMSPSRSILPGDQGDRGNAEEPTESEEAAAQSPTRYPEGRLMTVADVAAYLQVAEIFVYRHAKEMAAFKVGSHLRFKKSRVDEWLEARIVEDGPPECRPNVDNDLVTRLMRKNRKGG